MLPLKIDYAPMEAQLVDQLPSSAGWQFEPKWDGFRCLAFRDGETVHLRSKSGQPLERYFPEVVANLLALKAEQFVLDGEIVVTHMEQFAFDLLLERIHPAESRIKKLARETPAQFFIFDILVDDKGDVLTEQILEKRRVALERFANKYLKSNRDILLSPATSDFQHAQKWWQIVGQGLDGLVAKKLGLPYQSGNRTGMVKVKKLRTADCVVGGFRFSAADDQAIGSLLLGLYDHDGLLHHVGYTSSFKAKERREIYKEIAHLVTESSFTGSTPGGPSRWSTKRSEEWVALNPVLVVEVQYDHYDSGRFRHGTKLLRWRPDKHPSQCTLDQVIGNKYTAKEVLRRVS